MIGAMCQDQYDPKNGGRGIRNYIKMTIRKDVAKTILQNPNEPGVVEVTYTGNKDKKQSKISSEFIPRSAVQPANNNTPKKAEKQFAPK